MQYVHCGPGKLCNARKKCNRLLYVFNYTLSRNKTAGTSIKFFKDVMFSENCSLGFSYRVQLQESIKKEVQGSSQGNEMRCGEGISIKVLPGPFLGQSWWRAAFLSYFKVMLSPFRNKGFKSG